MINETDTISALMGLKYNFKTFSKNTEKKAERKQKTMWYLSALHCRQNTYRTSVSGACVSQNNVILKSQKKKKNLHSLDKKSPASSKDPTHFCNGFLQGAYPKITLNMKVANIPHYLHFSV